VPPAAARRLFNPAEAVELRCSDSDAALRALLDRYAAARNVEVHGAGLEDAFFALSGTDDEVAA
jgi:ABC-2 type transport system ATP-binding protein